MRNQARSRWSLRTLAPAVVALLAAACTPDSLVSPDAPDPAFARGGGGGGGKPSVESILPTNLPQGATGVLMDVFGAGFTTESQVEFELDGNPTTAVTAGSIVTFIDEGHLVADVTVEDGAAAVTYDVAVRNGPKKKGVGIDLLKIDSNEAADPAIAFTVQGTVEELRVMNASGAFETVVFQTEWGLGLGRPTWSPSGDRLAFTGSGATKGLHVMDVTIGADGGPQGGTPVFVAPRELGTNAAWSPLGNEIALGEGHTNDQPSSLWVIAPDDTGLDSVYSAPAGRVVYYPAWGPDGTKIAFVERVVTANGDGFDPVIMVVDRAHGTVLSALSWTEFENIREITWERGTGATRIAFAARGGGRRPKDREYHVYTVDIDIGEGDLLQIVKGRFPSWSPDDSELAYRTSNSKLAVITLLTGAVRTLSASNVTEIDWRR